MIDKYTKELERALNPREWDKELNDAWHRNIPDLQKAFDDIKNIAIKRSEVKMKHTIEIEGLPEGWEPVAIRKQKLGEHIFCLDTGFVVPADHRTPKAHLIVKKKQPRRIVLEEIRCDYTVAPGEFYGDDIAGFSRNNDDSEIGLHLPKSIWREVKKPTYP